METFNVTAHIETTQSRIFDLKTQHLVGCQYSLQREAIKARQASHELADAQIYQLA